MADMICHICLRTDIIAVGITTELTYFFDELCDYSNLKNPKYMYCTICAHLLKKFYNFKQRCLKACKILKSFKGKKQVLPTDLHEQIPSSIGLCSSLAPYKLLEHQHHTDTEPDLKNDPNVTSNNTEVHNKQNTETADLTLQDHIEVKDELMHDVPDSNVETLQAANGGSLYVITTSDGNLILRSNFEKEINSIQLDTEELNTDNGRNTNGSKDISKQSIISDFLESFEKNLEEDDNSIDAYDMEVLDDTLLNNDSLKDDESLNSIDDIESDISDCDVNSINMDEQNTEFDSDTDSLAELIERAKNKKLKVSKIDDLELAEKLYRMDRKNKLLRNRVKFLKGETKIKKRPNKFKGKAEIKIGLLKLFENDEYDLGDGVKISKEAFLKVYERYEKNSYPHKGKDTSNKRKTDEFLRFLLKMYNPEYETVFDIEYLDTEEKKLQEFNRRKESAEYRDAPYQCERCYKGFHLVQLHAYHMKKHDESSGPHECHICSLRFHSLVRRRSHYRKCHTAVYVCRLCHITLYYFASMRNHFNLHKGKEFPCPICNGIYNTSTSLANHKRIHVTSHICTTCAKSFVSAKGLSNHRKLKHKDAPEPSPADVVRCGECTLTLDSRKAYESHLKISHRKRDYVCGNCCKRFPSLAELRQHKVEEGHQHSFRFKEGNITPWFRITRNSGKSKGPPREKGEKRTCPICQEKVRFLYPHHMRQHPGVPYQMVDAGTAKNYLCDECGKQFIIYTHFLDHKNIHTGDRPYMCPECPRAFATATRLRSHSVWHRPPTHKCKVCGKLFHQPSNLGAHIRMHLNDRSYKCGICSSSFLHATSLKEHIRGVHQQQRRVRKRKQT